MKAIRRCLVSALLFTFPFLGSLRPVWGQTPPQSPPAAANAASAAPAQGATTPAQRAEEKPIRDMIASASGRMVRLLL
jgi:hypothetical protein